MFLSFDLEALTKKNNCERAVNHNFAENSEMCPQDISPKRVDIKKVNSDSDHARRALDSLIDFAIECAMEFHQPSSDERMSSVKRDLCCKIY